MKCVILAAGSMLHREAPKSGAWPKEPKPKTLYHVRGEVLLELQVKLLQKVGIRDIIVVVGYKKELIEQFVKKKNLQVRLIFCPESVNDAKWHRSGNYRHGMDSIRAGLKGIDDDVIFVMGDVYTTVNDLRQIVEHPDELTVWRGKGHNFHIFKVAKKYLPKLRVYNAIKGIPIHHFIFREKNIRFKGPKGAYKKWCRENCSLAKETFDVDNYKRTDESKKVI